MKVIPFTYHQMVSYLTEEGPVDLLGNQLAARQCYQVVLDYGHLAGWNHQIQWSNSNY